jgi:uncharacterized protein YabN with tetrapyrrole methylase and pyrophosphatase domain
LGRAADTVPGRQIDADSRVRVAVEHRVDAGAAVDVVGAAETLERVIAAQAVDGVGRVRAVEAVAAVGAIDRRHGQVLSL